MQFDLVSAYSVRVSWVENDVIRVDCYSGDFNQSAKCEDGDKSVVVVNLEPQTTYSVRLTKSDGSFTNSEVVTCANTDPCLENLYKGIQTEEGTFDTTRLNKVSHDVFVANFSEIVTSGDSILATVSINGVPKSIMTSAVTDGSKMTVNNTSNVFLPFSKDNASFMQTVTLTYESSKQSATLAYDAEDDAFGYGGEMYRVGDKFEMFGQMVTVGDGSIVLLFSDTVAKTWAFQPTNALAVVGAAGSHFMKNVTAQVYNTMTSKTTGAAASTYSSAWVHDTDLSTTEEITRVVHSIDELSENATVSIGVLHTDVALNRFIEPVIQSTWDHTIISAQDAADATRSTVFRSTGIEFDNDESSIYFGAAQEWRLQMTAGTPSLFSIQFYDTVAGEYVSKSEFSSGS